MSHNKESDIIKHGEINLRSKESEMNFKTIADQSLMGIAIIQDDLIKYTNQKLADLLEYSVEEIINWEPEEFYKVIGPESIELIKEQSPLKQMGLSGAMDYMIAQLKKKSGKLFWVENFSKTVMYQERTANFVTIIDITRRVEAEQKLKESEKKFKVLFNNSTSGIAYHKIVYDSDGNPVDYIITEINPQFEKVLPFKREDVINKISTEAYKVEQAPYLDIYSEVAKTQKSTFFETYFPPIDRHFNISVISPRKGNFITVFDNISERKKAEQKVRESEEKYREAYNRANFYKDLFAHDINNIMQVINSSAELISHETEKSKNIEMMATIIKKQITRAKKLVQNVILLSDLEEIHQPLKLTEICELLRNSIKFIYNSFPKKDIDLKIESLNKAIFVQANELLQDVFENILTNAVKYNDKTTVLLEIKISKAHKEGKNYVKIEFRDNGIGIADDRKAIIFEKGHRELKGYKGMGLGLSLVKKIINIYDGKIWIEDRVKRDYNQGSNFILLIPQD